VTSPPRDIAVIPKHADRAGTGFQEPRWSARCPTLATISHAPEGAKKQSSPPRPEAAQRAKTKVETEQSCFGDDLLPIFVPAVNRLDDGFAAVLAQAGYVGVSTYLPREAACSNRHLVTDQHRISTDLLPHTG